jgi:hypothetical protein
VQQYGSSSQIFVAHGVQVETSASPLLQIPCSHAEADVELLDELVALLVVLDFELVLLLVEFATVEVVLLLVELLVEVVELPAELPLPEPAVAPAASNAPFGVPQPVGPS